MTTRHTNIDRNMYSHEATIASLLSAGRLPTNYPLVIISKVIVCFLDYYSLMKSDFVFVISNINHKKVK